MTTAVRIAVLVAVCLVPAAGIAGAEASSPERPAEPVGPTGDRVENESEEGEESHGATSGEDLVVTEAVTVTAIRAADEVPVTKRNLDAEEIEKLSHGQDVPALLAHTPSLTWYSDSGLGSNYSYFSLRGIGQSRINITLDGAPLNDPAEHALYFNNFHDLLSAVDSIQIQRGVGTSSVGSPAYGGSVNFASLAPEPEPEVSARVGLGSHETKSASLAVHTGSFANGLSMFGRASYRASDGYRERSGTEHDSLFLNALWQGDRTQVRLVSFSGRERSGLAFLAVDPATLEENPRFNPLAAEERDRFGQDFLQLQLVRSQADDDVLTASLYYNGAAGWFRLWDDPVARGELLEFGIDQYFVGSMVSLSRTRGPWHSTFGLHYNDFRGEHTLDIEAGRLYANTGLKTQANAFLKLSRERGDWLVYGDLQLRWAGFEYRGDLDLGSVSWMFVDPKVGVRYALSPELSVYASIGKAEREPSRIDLLAGEDNASVRHDLEAVQAERVVDLELGFEYRTAELALQGVLYDMTFDNEIAATGELSDVGLPLRTNVADSFRRGLEVDLLWRAARHWTLATSAALSRNRIRSWTQYYDVYDAAGERVGTVPRVHRDVEPLLTPPLVVNQSVEWARGAIELAASGRWVAASHLDNTGDRRFRAPSHLVIGLRGAFDPGRSRSSGGARLAFHLDNLLDQDDHYPAGYSYLFVTRDANGREAIDGIPFYYPLAGRTLAVTLELSL